MTSKQKHIVIIISVIVALVVLVVPIFFAKDGSLNPWIWFSSQIPAAPDLQDVPKQSWPKMDKSQLNTGSGLKVYTVAIQAPQDLQQAQQLTAQLKASGLPAYLPKAQEKYEGLILIGPQPSEEAAEKVFEGIPKAHQADAKVIPFDPGY